MAKFGLKVETSAVCIRRKQIIVGRPVFPQLQLVMAFRFENQGWCWSILMLRILENTSEVRMNMGLVWRGISKVVPDGLPMAFCGNNKRGGFLDGLLTSQRRINPFHIGIVHCRKENIRGILFFSFVRSLSFDVSAVCKMVCSL